MMVKRYIALFLVVFIIQFTPACRLTSETTDSNAGKQDADIEKKEIPAWFELSMTDVRSDESFTVSDLSGKVLLVETMAMWCPTCLKQELEVQKLHDLLGEREDFVSIAMDIDSNENADALNDYIDDNNFDWIFTISTQEIKRDIGNRYGANFLNPPLVPMLIVDRNGDVYTLPYGLKKAEALLKTIQPFLDEN